MRWVEVATQRGAITRLLAKHGLGPQPLGELRSRDGEALSPSRLLLKISTKSYPKARARIPAARERADH